LIVFLLSQERSTTVINRKNRFEAMERGLKEAEWEIRKNYSTPS
jgi:Tfp pilus assembly protein PilX